MKKRQVKQDSKEEMNLLIIFWAILLHIHLGEYGLYDKVDFCVE